VHIEIPLDVIIAEMEDITAAGLDAAVETGPTAEVASEAQSFSTKPGGR